MIVPNLAPALLLGVTVATLIGAVVHALRGRTTRDFFGIWIVSQGGFWLAHAAASLVNAPLYSVGDLQMVAGVAGSVVLLALAIVTHR
jgi:hypothetical protein